MAFNQFEVSKLLAECHRRCCICHKFCGVKMEMNHIDPASNSGGDDIDNAIPLCFECHAEVGHYNPKHPKGKKYSIEELKLHREQWIDICKNSPQVFAAVPERDVGPLESMLAELEYNLWVAELAEGPHPQERIGAPLKLTQYERAITEGSLMLLPDDVKAKVTEAYVAIGRAQAFNETRISVGPTGSAYRTAEDNLFVSLRNSVNTIKEALEKLKIYLNQ